MEASRATIGDLRSNFNGLNTLLGTAGVLEAKWFEYLSSNFDSLLRIDIDSDPTSKKTTIGFQKLGLEVTYDPAIVGLRSILESMTVANAHLSITMAKPKVS